MNLTAQQLNGTHIGKTVTIEYRRSTVTGELDAIHHTREVALENYRGQPVRFNYWTQLTIGGVQHNIVSAHTPITIQEEQ